MGGGCVWKVYWDGFKEIACRENKLDTGEDRQAREWEGASRLEKKKIYLLRKQDIPNMAMDYQERMTFTNGKSQYSMRYLV